MPVQGQSGQILRERAPVMVPRCETTTGADIGAGIAVICGTHGTLAPGATSSTAPSFSVATSFTAAACANSTVGTSPTLILSSVGAGSTRSGGGFVLPASATVPIFFSWITTTPTTTEGGGVWRLNPGGQIPFAGAPNSALYAIAAAAVTGSCMMSVAP